MSISSISPELDEDWLDCVSFEPLETAMTLFPCGHSLNEDTVEKLKATRFKCPFDQTPIQSTAPNYALRKIVASAIEKGNLANSESKSLEDRVEECVQEAPDLSGAVIGKDEKRNTPRSIKLEEMAKDLFGTEQRDPPKIENEIRNLFSEGGAGPCLADLVEKKDVEMLKFLLVQDKKSDGEKEHFFSVKNVSSCIEVLIARKEEASARLLIETEKNDFIVQKSKKVLFRQLARSGLVNGLQFVQTHCRMDLSRSVVHAIDGYCEGEMDLQIFLKTLQFYNKQGIAVSGPIDEKFGAKPFEKGVTWYGSAFINGFLTFPDRGFPYYGETLSQIAAKRRDHKLSQCLEKFI